MTLEKFNTLDEHEQFEALWDESTYIFDRLEDEFRVQPTWVLLHVGLDFVIFGCSLSRPEIG